MKSFLSELWGEAFPWGELRCIRGGAVQQQFFKAGETNDLISAAMEWDMGGWDAYFGILPRLSQSGKAEDCMTWTSVLWQDIDSKHLDGTKMSALLALGRASIAPNIVVDSGNGIHAYHLLREPVPFPAAAKVMKGMATAIGGDAVYDAPRVLRLPGTHNHKTDPPKPVRLLYFEPQRRVRFGDFSDYLPVESEFRPERIASDPRAYDLLPDWLRELIEEPTPKGYRSGVVFKVCMWLIRYGWKYEDIYTLIEDFPEGFGEKAAEMKASRAKAWVEHTVEKAAAAAQEGA